MSLFALTYLAGVLTIISPCILPVLPFVFARSDGAFLQSTLPMMCGMAITFALVASLAALGGGWAVHANQYGRVVAMAVLAFFGATLLFPRLADWLSRPLVRLGARLTNAEGAGGADAPSSPFSSFVLGIATGLLWAPCAGPILGLVLTGAALNGASASTSLLLLVYAAGAATSLTLALIVGGRVFGALKRSLGASEWIRRGLGVAVLASVVAIALGLDTGFLSRVSSASTTGLEQSLLTAASARDPASPTQAAPRTVPLGTLARAGETTNEALPDQGAIPPLDGATQWLNSTPLTRESLRGKVVLIDFWTYSCVNCIRTLPYLRAWADKYRDRGLVVIGVHAPEFAFERDVDNIRRAVAEFGIDYPVAVDNDYAIWRSFKNEYWPAHYFIDANGRIRHRHFGEGAYEKSEEVIQQLLAEAGRTVEKGHFATVEADGAALASDGSRALSPETYVGYERSVNFESRTAATRDESHDYELPETLAVNHWGLGGQWVIAAEKASPAASGGRLVYRFRARDVNLVLGPAGDGAAVRFRVLVDGNAPGADHGIDTDADGAGRIDHQRLYQLVRQRGDLTERTIEIEFLDAGVEVYAFTFG